MSARPSDQWLSREDVVLESSGVYFGLATVDIGSQKDVTLKAGVTVFPGMLTPTTTSGITVWHGDTTGLKAGTLFIGLASVVLNTYSTAVYTSNTTGTVKSGAGELYAISNFLASCPTVSLYDSLLPSGTKIMDIPPNVATGTFYLRRTLTTGLTVECTAGVSPYLVFSYK